MKNILGTLVGEMLTNWNMAKVAIMNTTTHMAHLDRMLAALKANLAGRRYSLFRHSTPPHDSRPAAHSEGLVGNPIVHAEGASTATEIYAIDSSLPDFLGVATAEGATLVLGPSLGPSSPTTVVVQGASPPRTSFLMRSTVDTLHYKRVRKTMNNTTIQRKTEPLPIKLPFQNWEDDFFGSCPIIEDNHAEAST